MGNHLSPVLMACDYILHCVHMLSLGMYLHVYLHEFRHLLTVTSVAYSRLEVRPHPNVDSNDGFRLGIHEHLTGRHT